jgi:ABC-type antimicrobial peptide transport system permease subunit
MKRDKARTIFAIGGISISILLLTAIGMVNDTMGYNYMKIVTNTTGNADIMITRSLQTDLTFDPFFPESLIDNELADIEGVDELFPRVMMLVKVSSDYTNKNGSLQLYGLDFKAEAENGNMGSLLIVDDDGKETEEIYEGEPGDDEVVIFSKVAELLNVSRGQVIHLQYQQWTRDVTVIEICEQEFKFMQFENALILVNLPYAQDFLNRPGEINMIFGLIENPQQVYDTRNLDITQTRLREIGTRIQERLDINEYMVTMPKLEELKSAEMMLMMTVIIFWFITILSMLITGILINSILSTSVEERVREFGIARVVGGKKNYPMKIVIFEGLLFGVIGSIIGILLGYFFTPITTSGVFSMFSDYFDPTKIDYFIQPETIIIAFSIGSIVSLVVAMLPAIKTAKMDIIKSITPFQTKEEGWEVTKEGSVNVRSFLIGISIATIGMIIFVLFPRIMTTGDMMLIIALFIGLLAAVLIGLVFASVGIIPLIQKGFIGIISPAVKRYSNIIKISLKRYRRRNTSTVVMFAISFSFIFFITSISQMEKENFELNFKFQYGADLVIINQGSVENNDAATLGMIDELKVFGGIDEISYAVHNTFDIQAAIGMIFDVSGGGFGFDEEGAEQQIMNLFSYYSRQWQTKYTTFIADMVDFKSLDAGFIGVDMDFINMVDQDLMIWSSPNSNFNSSFTKMLNGNNTCIIAKAIANVLGINDVGEYVRITFHDPQVENDPGNITIFEVVGISGGIPGFWNFRSSEFSASGGGVMVSTDVYEDLMDLANPGTDDMIVDKIFINLADATEETIKKTKEDITALYKDKSLVIDDAISKINFINEMNDQQSVLMEIILMFTVIICIFGLVSSMYAIMLERKFEIGILRSMGMKARNVRSMFLIESLVILLSAGIMGTIIGSYSAYLMETNLGLLTEMPVIFSIPMDTLLRVFIISVSVGALGMYLILLKLSRQTIMDVFRQSF